MPIVKILTVAAVALALTACGDPERAQAIGASFNKGFSNGLRYPSSSTTRCTTISRKGFSETTCHRR